MDIERKIHKASTTTFIIGMIVLISVSISVFLYLTNRVRRDEERGLLLRVQSIAAIINPSQIEQLSGTDADINNPTYVSIKDSLTKLHSINSDTRFVYLMGLRDDRQFFFADSEDPSSKDYSPPGQWYDDATDLDIANHKNGISYIHGPYHDSWGTWISAYAPVYDQISGQTVAMVGMDVDSTHFMNIIRIAQGIVIIISLLVILILFLGLKDLQREIRNSADLNAINNQIQIDKDHLIEASTLGGICMSTWYATRKIVELNSQGVSLLGLKSHKINEEEIKNYVPLKDQENIKSKIEKASDGESIVVDHQLIISNGQTIQARSSGKIRKDSHGNLVSIVFATVPLTNTV